MATKLKLKKVQQVNPSTKESGFAARPVLNGTIELDSIIASVARNSTFSEGEVAGIIRDMIKAVAEGLSAGNKVSLGVLGAIEPSVTSGWEAKAEDLHIDGIKAKPIYKPSDEVKAAVGAIILAWSRATDNDADTSDDDHTDQGNQSGTGSGSNGGVLE